MDDSKYDVCEELNKSLNSQEHNWTFGELLEKVGIEDGVNGALMGDFAYRAKCYALGIEYGFLTPREVRKLELLPELKEHNDGGI